MSYPQFGYPYPSVGGGLTSAQLLTSVATTPTSISPATSCCEGGRPIMTDPATGQTICSCQYTPALLGSYPRMAGLPESVYSSAAYAAHGLMPLGTDPSAFYSPLTAGSSTAVGYPYDPTMTSYSPYSNGYGGVDLQARRKNATRESTNTLKAWLYEHRKNPYPTKGEKIMLAIITKMTLTQVSTWFANARRRLKKENKMTWSPRNRTGDEEDGEDGDKSDAEDKDQDHEDGLAIDVESAADLDDVLKDDVMGDKSDDVISAISPAASPLGSVTGSEHDISKSRLDASDIHSAGGQDDLSRLSADRDIASPQRVDCTKSHTKDSHKGSAQDKPKIWSLAQVATSTTPPPPRRSPLPQPQFPIRPAHTGYLPSGMSGLGGVINGLRYAPYSLASSLASASPALPHFALASRGGLGLGGNGPTPPHTPPHSHHGSGGGLIMATPLAVHAKPMLSFQNGTTSSVMAPTDLSKSSTLQSLRDSQHGTAFKPVAIR